MKSVKSELDKAQEKFNNLDGEATVTLAKALREREASITVALEGRSQSEIWEERLLAIEARLDKLEQVGRKQ